MEVHKHPHHVTHKKKWTEYLLEFFMLFLAVFLGFVAENVRETIVESNREKQFMKSMISDLKLDTAYSNLCVHDINARIFSIDSVLDYFVAHPKASSVPISTFQQMKRSTWDRIFIDHTGTIDQLKYSGGLRLIHKRQIVNSIESYYQQLIRFAEFGHTLYRTNQDKAYDLQGKIVDAIGNTRFEQHLVGTDTATIAINGNYLNEYLNHLLHLKGSATNDRKADSTITRKANNLISLIEKEYHLKDESTN